MSVLKAILTGLLWVNGPVAIFLMGPLGALALGNEYGFIPRSQNWLILILFPAGFVLAWLWWSLTVPKWRLWAYERVSDIPRLKGWAVTVGLTWPDGSLFARTEIKSAGHAARERELDPTPTDEGDDDGDDDDGDGR